MERRLGSYLLLLRLEAPTELIVGRLGRIAFAAGWYVYVGSALGGLAARLRWHARRDKPPHWHVDALRAVAELVAVATYESPERLECVIAARVAALPGATVPVRRFGASDCRCPAHLVYFDAEPDPRLDQDWAVEAVRRPERLTLRRPQTPATPDRRRGAGRRSRPAPRSD